MTKIKIIKGTYGLRDGYRVIPKTSKDEPFEMAVEKAARLIKLGVAVIVGEGAENQKNGGDPDDLSKLKKPQLQALAAEKGIEFSDKTTAAELKALIAGGQAEPAKTPEVTPESITDDEEDDGVENESTDDDGTPPPELTVQDVIPGV
jgi:hypothetical protein